jgi:ABC-2 type transport system ATP-binding protein
MININNLSKKYGSKPVLDNLNMSFEKGNVYGIVGENGAGKTTLFRILAGIESYEGSIKSEFGNIKNHLGFLETTPVLMSRITGWEYLKLHCIARKIDTDDFENQNIFDLPLNQYAETYSTGMKKKLALMAILLQKNEVFILDEPFNGVDIQSNIIIVDLIQELKRKNKIVLIASHIFSTLSETCDEIWLIKDTKIENRVTKEKFTELENEMKSFIINDQIKKLIIE